MPSLKQSTGHKERVSKDDYCFLISEIITQDELLQDIVSKSERQLFCSKLSIGQKEFTSTFQSLKSEMVIIIDHDEYDGEKLLMYGEETYSIYRTFVRSDGDIELYCEVRVGGG